MGWQVYSLRSSQPPTFRQSLHSKNSYFLLNGFPGSLGSQTVTGAGWLVFAFVAITGPASKEETTSAVPRSQSFVMRRSFWFRVTQKTKCGRERRFRLLKDN